MVLGAIFLAVCALYVGALRIGWHLAKRERLAVTRVKRTRRTFTDPLTRRFQQWCHGQKMKAIRQQQWVRLRLLIFANNLGAAHWAYALRGRACASGVLTYRHGLSHGTLAAQLPMRPRGVLLQVAALEFGAYLLATALGVNLVMTPVVGGAFKDALRSLVLFYPVIAAALLVGAWLEVHMLRSQLPVGFQMPGGLNLEELRAKALDMLKRQSGGTA